MGSCKVPRPSRQHTKQGARNCCIHEVGAGALGVGYFTSVVAYRVAATKVMHARGFQKRQKETPGATMGVNAHPPPPPPNHICGQYGAWQQSQDVHFADWALGWNELKPTQSVFEAFESRLLATPKTIVRLVCPCHQAIPH